jgi:hypothetical protein
MNVKKSRDVDRILKKNQHNHNFYRKHKRAINNESNLWRSYWKWTPMKGPEITKHL